MRQLSVILWSFKDAHTLHTEMCGHFSCAYLKGFPAARPKFTHLCTPHSFPVQTAADCQRGTTMALLQQLLRYQGLLQ